MISVVIPVGPYPSNTKWLQDALDSIYTQTVMPEEILLINDGHVNLSAYLGPRIRTWAPPWHSGVAHSFNYGVALATSELVLMMGSDDLLRPTCIEQCLMTYLVHEEQDAYYWLDVEYMSTHNVQSIACNAACVTKGLWKLTGGIPIEASCGGGDAALLSIMIAHKLPMIRIPTDTPSYIYRDHAETDTVRRSRWHQAIIDIRGLVTEEWQSK